MTIQDILRLLRLLESVHMVLTQSGTPRVLRYRLFDFWKLWISEVFHFRKTPDSSEPLFPVPPDPMFSSMFVFRDLRYMFLCTVFTPSPVTLTGDKGLNNHWAHCEHIESIGNM